MKTFVKIVAVLISSPAWGGRLVLWLKQAKPAITFRTVEVARGDVLQSIAATGTAEPQETVDVGAQVAGLIDRFGPDLCQPGKPWITARR